MIPGVLYRSKVTGKVPPLLEKCLEWRREKYGKKGLNP
jgi:hypothetical protein